MCVYVRAWVCVGVHAWVCVGGGGVFVCAQKVDGRKLAIKHSKTLNVDLHTLTYCIYRGR